MTERASTATTRGELSDEARERLADLAVPREFAPGEVILRESAAVPFVAVVESGRAALRLHVPGRGAVTIVTIEPRELLGWSAVVPPYRATSEAVAVEPTRLVTYDAAAFRDRMLADPAFCAIVAPTLLMALSDRLTTSWHQLLDLFGEQVFEPW